MGIRFENWKSRSKAQPETYTEIANLIRENRSFSAVNTLDYGDYGLNEAFQAVYAAIKANKKIALYADYDVDGTMSCTSWIWFFKAISYSNYTYYIPDRRSEGYGVNLDAIKHLVNDLHAELIITMDTGITANVEAAWCKKNGVVFICTDHHKVQADKMPDCITLNPKFHPDPMYQELCGCGITFVLLRKFKNIFKIDQNVWLDILALTGMATICDVVPLNGVNHKIIQQGISALLHSQRPVLKKLLAACASKNKSLDERGIAFRLGPRINAVGRLYHASEVIKAFIEENPSSLIRFMAKCNEERKQIQEQIVAEARSRAMQTPNDSIIFLGGNWHPGVVGIAASKIAEEFWKPVWLFEKGNLCKGSARSIPGFDVTDAMVSCKDHFLKFGGHTAAGGFSFEAENENIIRKKMNTFAEEHRKEHPKLWQSVAYYDCQLSLDLINLGLATALEPIRPFGHKFEEPVFRINAEIQKLQYYNDKSTGQPRHTAVFIKGKYDSSHKIMFFNDLCEHIRGHKHASFLINASKETWRGQTKMSMFGCDYMV